MNYDYCTHIPLLYEACRVTDGLVVELGVGICSTPLLHALAAYGENPRHLISVDDSENWLAVMHSRMGTKNHEFIHVPSWEKKWLRGFVDLNPGLVFIDQGQIDNIGGCVVDRWESIWAFQDAGVLVIHDESNILAYDKEALKKAGEVFQHFYLDDHTKPTTLWLSKTIGPEFVLTKRS